MTDRHNHLCDLGIRRLGRLQQPGNFAPCTVALGEPIRFEGLPKGGRGYKEATAEIERRINVIFDWLAEYHARGRPRDELPPL